MRVIQGFTLVFPAFPRMFSFVVHMSCRRCLPGLGRLCTAVPAAHFFLGRAAGRAWCIFDQVVCGCIVCRLARASGLGLGSCCSFWFSAVGAAHLSVLAAQFEFLVKRCFFAFVDINIRLRGDGLSSLRSHRLEKLFESAQYPFQWQCCCERVASA